MNEIRSGLLQHKDGSGAGVVCRLTKDLEGMWYTIAMDNFFRGPTLFDDLLGQGFYAVGTVRKHRRGFPSSLKLPSKGGERGTLHVRMHRDL